MRNLPYIRHKTLFVKMASFLHCELSGMSLHEKLVRMTSTPTSRLEIEDLAFEAFAENQVKHGFD
jgi:hypothetical protein